MQRNSGCSSRMAWAAPQTMAWAGLIFDCAGEVATAPEVIRTRRGGFDVADPWPLLEAGVGVSVETEASCLMRSSKLAARVFCEDARVSAAGAGMSKARKSAMP